MKKAFLFILLVILGFGAHGMTAQAAAPGAAATIGPEEARILSQALDILKTILADLETKAASPGTSINSVVIVNTLSQIEKQLVVITTTIGGSETLAIKTDEAAAPVAAAPRPPAPTETMTKDVTAKADVPAPVLTREETPVLLDDEEAFSPFVDNEAVEETEVATVSATVNPRNIAVAVIILAAVLGALFMWWRKGGEEETARAHGKEKKTIVQPTAQEGLPSFPPDY